MNGIFKTANQALHFSYVIEQYPPDTLSQMHGILESLRRESGEPHELRMTTVDMSGLTPLEIRSQCSDIRAQVRAQLQPLQAQLLEARFSQDRDTKRHAIRAIAEHVAPQLALPVDVALALAWRHYVDKERRQRDFTFRQIAESYAITKSAAHRAAGQLEAIITQLEGDAVGMLAPIFELANIIDTPPGRAA